MPCRAAFLVCVSPTTGTEAVGCGAVDSHGRGSQMEHPQDVLGDPRGWCGSSRAPRFEEVKAGELASRGAWRDVGMGPGWGKTESDCS